MKFLMFLYLVSVVVFILAFVWMTAQENELYDKFEVERPRRSLLYKLLSWVFWCAVSLIPVMRLLLLVLVFAGYCMKKDELEEQTKITG